MRRERDYSLRQPVRRVCLTQNEMGVTSRLNRRSAQAPHSSMRALKKVREIPTRLDGSFESLLAQFSATTLELSPSHGTPEFARRLTARAAEMLGARACVLALHAGGEWKIGALAGPAHRWDAETQARLAAALAERASTPAGGSAGDMRPGLASMLLGRELAEALGWREVLLVRLAQSEGELLGVLCLVDLAHVLSS